MLRRGALSLAAAFVSQLWLSGPALAQEAAPPPPEAPPPEAAPAPEAAPPAPAATPAPAAVEPPQAVPGPGAKERTEEIVVTGSRIRRKDLTTPAPVAIINRDTIEASGKVSLGDFLQALPEQGNALNTQVNNGNDGSVRVNLRSLSSVRTLVLINGRRVVNGGTTVGDGPDLNSIPAAAVERIEILKDGASAVYGSDAVAGVVNVILKKRFEGTEVSGYTGTSSRGDATTYDLSATTGTVSDKGNILFSVGYQEQKSVLAGDRPWSETTFDFNFTTRLKTPTGNSSTFPQGRFSLPVVRDVDGNITGCRTTPTTVTPLYNRLCDRAITAQDNRFTPDATAVDGYALYDDSLFNTNPTNYLVTPNRRVQLFATGDTNIGDVARGFFEASYVNRRSAQTLAPMPVVNSTIPDKPVTVSADSIYNPFGLNITSWRRRASEFGDRFWRQDLDTFRVVTGLDGSLGGWASVLEGWNWEVSYNYGRTSGNEVNDGILRMPNVANATGPSMISTSGNPICVRVPGQEATEIKGCVPWDVLHGVPTSVSPGLKDYLTYTGSLTSFNKLEVYSVNAGGDLVRLFAERPIGLALGFDFRKEAGEYLPDVISASLESAGNNVKPTKGSYEVKEGYAELSVPIVGNMPWAEEVEASAAARIVDYSTFGSKTSYKFGARWSPFRDVSLRGTASTAFRAPNISELFGGATDSYPRVTDPCADLTGLSAGNPLFDACTAQGVPVPGSQDPSVQLLEKWLASPDLKPETANIYTAGVVVQPRWVPNLSATIDYYNIKVDDAIALTGAGYILNQCYPSQPGAVSNEALCKLVHREAGTGLVLQIDDPRVNRFTYKTAGLDFAVRYGLPTPKFGRFNFVFDATWLLKFEQIDPQGENLSGRGNYDLAVAASGTSSPGGALPNFKFNAGVGWTMAGLGLGVATRYISPLEECFDAVSGGGGLCSAGARADGSRMIGYYMPVDVYASYAMKSRAGRTSIMAGVQNVLDRDPPYVFSAFAANTDPSTYDFLGRFFFVRLTQGY